MRQNVYNFVFFLLIAGGLAALWLYADQNWFPKNEAVKQDEKKDDDKKKEPEKKKDDDKKKEPEKKDEPKPVPKIEPYVPPELIAIGGEGFYIQSLLTTQGGGVQLVVLPEFEQVDRLGRGVRLNENEKKFAPLHLIPGIVQKHGPLLADNPPVPKLRPGKGLNPKDPRTPEDERLAEPSYTLFHYASPDDKYPDPLLGTVNWRMVEKQTPADGPHQIAFETDALKNAPYFLIIRKTYTLGKKDYHIGMKVEFERLPGGHKGKGLTQFQISGPRQLPVGGEWYTSLTRVALIGWKTKKGAIERQYDDASTIGSQRGGESAPSAGGDNTFKYAAIATQYVASALAIDDAEGKTKWAYVRSTSELEFIPPPEEIKKLEELVKKPENRALIPEAQRIRGLRDRKLPELDDITFRAVLEPIDLEAGEKLVHGYAIYNGPTKVELLSYLRGDKKVDEALVKKYHEEFQLGTLTDYRSPTMIGNFAKTIGWTYVVITFTNLMHELLYYIHYVIGNWGLSIIVLTIMVRLLLFIPSRKQTQLNMKQMEMQKRLKPELDKLHEKYKDDFQTYNREKTRLLMQNGMNPFAMMGGCLLLFAQMPIMMGLYYCLQESIFFRLDEFLWVRNLAAPDMTVWWTEGVPLISDPDNRHGTFSFLYLGPYLNILPLIAVSLMLYQQNKMMPTPTDEQQAQQQRMMKIMMIVVAFMFYKVAAGLALYFIISTTWGLIERQLIPKPTDKPADDAGNGAALTPKSGSPNGRDEPVQSKGLFGRFRQRLQDKVEELQKKAAEQSSRQVKNPSRNEPVRNPGRDKKKRKQ